MSQFVIYIKLEKYISEWLTHSLGYPVRFPNGSNENAVIRAFIQQTPKGETPDTAAEGMTPIYIPDSKAKPPESYNYMTDSGKKAVREAKLAWLEKYNFPFDHFHGIQYGATKAGSVRKFTNNAWLIDDNAKVRNGWHLGEAIDPAEVDILSLFEGLI